MKCPHCLVEFHAEWQNRDLGRDPKLIYYHRAEKGGHFAAWEQPMIFTEELRAAFRSLR